MNCALIKKQLFKNQKLIYGVLAMTIFYVILMIFTADLMQGDFMRDLVESMMRSMGESEEAIAAAISEFDDMTPLNFVANGFYTLYFQLFMMVLYIMLVSRYIVKPVDTTNLSCYLSLPISRKNYVRTTFMSLFIAVFVCGLVAYASGYITFAIKSADINYWDYLNVVATATLVSLSVAFISLTCGFVFSGTKFKSLSFIAPIVFLFIIMIASMDESLLWLRWLTPFGWADNVKLAAGEFSLWWLVDLGCIAIAGICVYLSSYFFKKRNLSI
jgi:hypothetical protein